MFVGRRLIGVDSGWTSSRKPAAPDDGGDVPLVGMLSRELREISMTLIPSYLIKIKIKISGLETGVFLFYTRRSGDAIVS